MDWNHIFILKEECQYGILVILLFVGMMVVTFIGDSFHNKSGSCKANFSASNEHGSVVFEVKQVLQSLGFKKVIIFLENVNQTIFELFSWLMKDSEKFLRFAFVL